MRLTLRTMLAYLDEILEPDDAADIGKKIEESEFATSLMHRLRDSTRRVRLGAPATLGKGLALDPNTVAEYLDNTLESERVAEFEKICLESDVHLAELTSCHEVLTLVLGEPAHVDPALRERMYQVVHSAQRLPRGESASPPVAIRPAPPPVTKVEPPPVQRARERRKPEVPDYLRASRRNPWWAIAAVLLIAALIFGGFALAAPDRMKAMIASVTGGAGGVDENEADQQSDARGDQEPSERPIEQPQHVPDNDRADEQGDADAVVAVPAGDNGRDVRFPDETPAVDEDSAVAPGPEEANTKVADSGDAPPSPDEVMPDDAAATTTDAASTDAAVAVTGAEAALPDDGADANVAGAADAGGDDETIAGLGRYLTSGEVLLRFNRAANEWQRLTGRATLMAGDRLLSLPAYTPSVSLSTGISIQPIGAAEFELEPPDAQGVPGVKIAFGKFNMLTLGKAANPLRVSFGGRQGTIVFSSPESTIALEVRPVLTAGSDPEQAPAAMAADLFAMTGAVSWDEEGAKSPLREPEHLPLTDVRASDMKEGELPRWTDYKPSDFIKRGAVAVEKAIAMDRPALLSLKELAEKPQEEIRSLAVQSAAYAGDFGPIAESLSDASLTNIETIAAARNEALRDAIARSPESAAAVRQALEKQSSEHGAVLYRMLWGYTSEQLETEAAKLIGYLEHEELPLRALSSLALQNSTSFQIRYRPTDPPARRKTAVKQWKDKLKDGKLGPAGPAPRAEKPEAKSTNRQRLAAELLQST